MAALIAVLVVALVVLVVLVRTIEIVPQSKAGIVERLGRYSRTLDAGLAIVIPFVDRLQPLLDMREQVVSFPAAGDHRGQPRRQHRFGHLLRVTEPKAATYEIADYIQAIEQLGDDAPQRDRRDLARGTRSPRATTSTRSCEACSTRRPASGGSASIASS